MSVTLPYRLQIHLENDIRKALKDAAHHHDTSLQQLVETWLIERLQREGLLPPEAQERARRQAVGHV